MPLPMKKILIVEDDVNLGLPLTGALEMQEYKVSYLSNGDKALNEFRNFKPDLVILDIALNGKLDGFDIAKRIRIESKVPILFTTSRDGNEDLKTGFSIANTDYVRKPYRLMEVMLRIENLLSKQEEVLTTQEIITKKKDVFQIGNYSFTPCEHLLLYECEKIHLNNYESVVLNMLCKNKNQYLSRNTIIEEVWKVDDSNLKDASLSNTVSNLRKHLSKDDSISIDSKIKLGIQLKIK